MGPELNTVHLSCSWDVKKIFDRRSLECGEFIRRSSFELDFDRLKIRACKTRLQHILKLFITNTSGRRKPVFRARILRLKKVSSNEER